MARFPFLLVLLFASPGQEQTVPPDIDALQKLITRHAAAIESGDLAALDGMYAPDAVVFENGGENRDGPTTATITSGRS